LLNYFLVSDIAHTNKLIGLSILAGIAGGNVIASLMQRFNLAERQEKVNFLSKQLKKFVVETAQKSPRGRAAKQSEEPLNPPEEKNW